MSAETELLDCPFCGSPTVNDTGFGSAWVCPECVACGPAAQSEEEATELWNTRTPDPINAAAPGTAAERDRLRELLGVMDKENYDLKASNAALVEALEAWVRCRDVDVKAEGTIKPQGWNQSRLNHLYDAAIRARGAE